MMWLIKGMCANTDLSSLTSLSLDGNRGGAMAVTYFVDLLTSSHRLAELNISNIHLGEVASLQVPVLGWV